MDKNNPNTDSELNWFWKLTTKWWFFPVFYVLLVSILTIIQIIKGVESGIQAMGVFLGILFLMPGGLVYYLQKIIPADDYAGQGFTLALFFHPFAILAIFLISYFKNKKNKILKWLVIVLFLLIILSFSGCVIAGLTNFKYFPHGF